MYARNLRDPDLYPYYMIGYFTASYLITHFLIPFGIIIVMNGHVCCSMITLRRARLALTRQVRMQVRFGEHACRTRCMCAIAGKYLVPHLHNCKSMLCCFQLHCNMKIRFQRIERPLRWTTKLTDLRIHKFHEANSYVHTPPWIVV